MPEPAGATSPVTLPEIGGALGRVATARPSPRHPDLDGIRIELASALFEAAGVCRERLATGDRAAALDALTPHRWLEIWEHAVTQAGRALAAGIDRAFEQAARESRMSRGALAQCVPTEPERRAITAHLGKGTRPLEQALDGLGKAAEALGRDRNAEPAAVTAWMEAVDLCARRTEAAWVELLEAADHEDSRWRVEVEGVRAWRRPRWPLWALSAAVVLIAIYLGLLAGGFLTPPEPLRPWAEFWWERL